MQNIISRIAAYYGFDLSVEQGHLQLEQPGLMPLHIQKIGAHQLSVAHYHIRDGEIHAHPDIVFLTGAGPWIPFESTQYVSDYVSDQDGNDGSGSTHGFNFYRRVARLAEDGLTIAGGNTKAQAALAHDCERWARKLKKQKWVPTSPEV